MKKIFKILSKIVLSIVIIYMYNVLAQPLNIIIPINLITILTVTVLGLPGMCALIVILII